MQCSDFIVVLLSGFSDDITFKNDKGEIIGSQTITAESFESGINGEIKGKLSGAIYNPFDVGFVAGFGAEVRLWRRTVVALQIRTDIGISNVENTKGLKITYDSDMTKEYDFKPWKGYYAKYTMPDATDIAKGFESNRPATKNFSAGVFLSIRKYLSY